MSHILTSRYAFHFKTSTLIRLYSSLFLWIILSARSVMIALQKMCEVGDITVSIFGKFHMPHKAGQYFWSNISWTLVDYELLDGNWLNLDIVNTMFSNQSYHRISLPMEICHQVRFVYFEAAWIILQYRSHLQRAHILWW